MRKHYIFYGYVQGVGFRWTARNAANLHNVTGFVRNLDDGTVEMEAEGSEEDIDKMIQTIEQSRYIQISEMKVREIPELDSYGFEIL